MADKTCETCKGTGRTPDNSQTFECWAQHYLVAAAPDVLWAYVEDVGSYQGTIFAVGRYKGRILLYVGYYGSCSGCGSWGEGGEPVTENDVLNGSALFEVFMKDQALEYAAKWESSWDGGPDANAVAGAIEEVANLTFG